MVETSAGCLSLLKVIWKSGTADSAVLWAQAWVPLLTDSHQSLWFPSQCMTEKDRAIGTNSESGQHELLLEGAAGLTQTSCSPQGHLSEPRKSKKCIRLVHCLMQCAIILKFHICSLLTNPSLPFPTGRSKPSRWLWCSRACWDLQPGSWPMWSTTGAEQTEEKNWDHRMSLHQGKNPLSMFIKTHVGMKHLALLVFLGPCAPLQENGFVLFSWCHTIWQLSWQGRSKHNSNGLGGNGQWKGQAFRTESPWNKRKFGTNLIRGRRVGHN